MKELTLEVPAEYPLIMLCVAILSIYVLIMPYFVVIPKRNKIFHPLYMKNFVLDHIKAFGPSAENPHLLAGFPDQGNGLYADKLPYKQWYELNNSIRVHHNFVESMPQIICILLISGLYFPMATLGIAALNCVTRPIYIVQYLNGGPNKRILGAVSGSAPLYALGLATFGKIAYSMMQ